MKCVGIIGAMEQEVARLKEVMEDVSITTRANMDFYEGVLEGIRCGFKPTSCPDQLAKAIRQALNEG